MENIEKSWKFKILEEYEPWTTSQAWALRQVFSLPVSFKQKIE